MQRRAGRGLGQFGRPHSFLVSLVALLAAATVLPAVALAHAYLDRADPPVGASVATPPAELRLTFSEEVDSSYSRVEVLNARREQVDRGDSHVSPDDPRTLIVSLPTNLPQGLYTVSWRTLSAVDGHTINGAYPLAIGNVAPADLAAASTASTSQLGFPYETAAARWWLYIAASLALGVLLAWRLVIGPLLVASNAAARPAVAARTRWLTLAALVALLIGTLYAAVAQAASAADVPLWGVFGGPIEDVLSRGRYASIWWPRFVLGVLALGLVAWRGVDRWAGLLASIFLAGVLLTSSLTSHGAALLSGSYDAVAADWLHFLGVAVWLGGLASMVFVLPTAVRASQRLGERLLAKAVQRFSNLALAAVVLIVVTGTFQAWLQVGSWDALIQTAYGQSLLAKIGLMALMIGLAAFNLLVARPRLARLAGSSGGAVSQVGRWFGRSVRAELGIGVLVLLVAAILTSLGPARQEWARQTSGASAPGPVDRTISAQGLTAQVQILPGVVGQNQFTVRLPNVDPSIVERVQLNLTYLDEELGSQLVVLPATEPGVWQVTAPLLSQPGSWQAELFVRQTGKDDVRSAFRFGVLSPGASPATTSASGVDAGYPLLPSPMVSLAYVLGLVGLLVIGWGLLRPGRVARNARMAVAAAGVLAIACGGLVYAREQSQGITLDVASIRNPVAPDAQSLARGQEIYDANCAACHGDTGRGDGPAGLRLVPRPADLRVHMAAGHTDGQLFYWVSYGVQGTAMPAWANTLTEEQRWDVINYIRTFAQSQP